MMVFHFNGALADVTPEDFVHHWLTGAGGVVTGSGFCFGRKRAGTVGVLARLAAERGMACEAINPAALEGRIVSSSRIRHALREGDCETAETLLTRPFAFCGRVHRSEQADDRFGCMATTIKLEGYVRPLAGAYAARLRLLDGRSIRCVAYCPSPVESLYRDVLRLETPGFWEELNNQAVEVDLLSRRATPAGECEEHSAMVRGLHAVLA